LQLQLQEKELKMYEFGSEPFKHQRECFEESKDLESFAILWEQGCGKTKLAIDNACYLYENGKIDGVLIIAPSGVHRNWLTDELPAHLPKRLKGVVRGKVWETSKANNISYKQDAEEFLKHKGFSWLFMSYDAFITDKGKDFAWKFLRSRRCFYALDEAHNIKSPKALRTKSITKSGKYAHYRRILTGTPIAQGPFDIYSQLKFLKEDFWDEYGFSSFRVYKFHFGEWLTKEQQEQISGYNPGYDKLLGYKNIHHLQKILGKVSSRVTKESAGLNLPPKLYSKRYFSLTPAQRKAYKSLRDEYVAVLDSGAVVEANLAITRLLRLQQIICGYVHIDQEEPVQLIGETNPRLQLLEEITDGLYHPAIIWSKFTKDIDQIMELLGDKAVRYDGQVSSEQAAINKERFQKGEVQFFVGNPQKGKEGLTLVQAKTVIYYSNSFKLIDRLQSEDRAHRIGQDTAVNYIDLVASDTVDEHIINSLREKFDIATKITGDDFRGWL
jgi:SNF2 family DNA or RNA helicase